MRLVLSVLTMVTVMVAIGGSSWAMFQDSATSSGNTFAAGTLDLKIREGAGGDESRFGDGVSISWSMANMKPGDEVYRWVDLRNTGTLPASSLRLRAANLVANASPDMDSKLEIVSSEFTDGIRTNVRDLIGDANGNGWKDLDDLEANPVSLPWDVNGGVHSLDMQVRFHPNAGNGYQGGTVTTTVTFTLVQ